AADEVATIRREWPRRDHVEETFQAPVAVRPVAVPVRICRHGKALGVVVGRQGDVQRCCLDREVTPRYVGQAGPIPEVEELVQERAAQIEIDEHYSLAHARKGDRKVGGRGRLAFLLDRARDHDRARVYVQVDELDVR